MVTNIPEAIQFLGNLKDLQFTSLGSAKTIKLTYKTSTFAFVVRPDAKGVASFDLKKSLAKLIEWIPMEEGVFDIPSFELEIDQQKYPFRVIDGGVMADTIDTPLWLSANFLTWQPNELRTYWNIPQWLTYVSLSAGRKVVFKYYFEKSIEIRKKDLVADKVNVIDVRYSKLSGEFDVAPYAIDVYVEDNAGSRMSYIQRYLLDDQVMLSPDVFVFQNTLGGIDSLLLDGKKTYMDTRESEYSSVDVYEEFNVKLSRSYKKSTGHLSFEEMKTRFLEFLKAKRKYIISESGKAERIIIDDSVEGESITDALNNAEFSFRIAKDMTYINMQRFDVANDPIKIISPSGELFPLAPRLIEFPTADVGANPLFLMQHPDEESWRRMSFSEVIRNVAKVIQNELPNSPVDRGEFKVGEVYYFFDEVTWLGCVWRCMVERTTAEPHSFSTDWVLRIGNKSIVLNVYSSEGTVFQASNVDTILSCQVMRGSEDITANILDADWTWERDSGNQADDRIWNIAHKDTTSSLHITIADLGDFLVTRKCKFIITAFVRIGSAVEKTTKTIDI